MPSIDEIILHKLWEALWQRSSSYYLPNILTKGFSQASIKIDPLEGKDLGSLGPISLFDAGGVLGQISVTLNNDNLTGLGEIMQGNFNYDDKSKQLILGIIIPNLRFGGNYVVDSTKLAGCAVGTASGLLNTFNTLESPVGEEGTESLTSDYSITSNADSSNFLGYNPDYDKALDLQASITNAKSYQKELQGSSAGDELDKIYAANNEILNIILGNPKNYFTHQWINRTTNKKSTRYFANQTNAASINREDKLINDDDYNSHSLYLSYILRQTAKEGASQNDENPDKDKYAKLLQDLDNFNKKVANAGYDTPNVTSVGNVMQIVKDAKTEENRTESLAQGARLNPHVAKVYAMAEADIQKWIEKHGSLIVGSPHDAYFISNPNSIFDSVLKGEFVDDFGNIICNLKMEVKVSDDTLTVNVKSIDLLNLDVVDIKLHGDNSSDLFNNVQNAISNLNPVKSLVRSHITENISSDDNKKGLSNIFNQVLKQLQGI